MKVNKNKINRKWGLDICSLFGAIATSKLRISLTISHHHQIVAFCELFTSLGTITPRNHCVEAEGGKAMASAIRQFLYLSRLNPHISSSSPSLVSRSPNCINHRSLTLRNRNQTAAEVMAMPVAKASAGNVGPSDDEDDGVSLGTMVLPLDTDLQRFESLLFQVCLPFQFCFLPSLHFPLWVYLMLVSELWFRDETRLARKSEFPCFNLFSLNRVAFVV